MAFRQQPHGSSVLGLRRQLAGPETAKEIAQRKVLRAPSLRRGLDSALPLETNSVLIVVRGSTSGGAWHGRDDGGAIRL